MEALLTQGVIQRCQPLRIVALCSAFTVALFLCACPMAMAWQSQDENAPQAEPDQAVNAATVPESMQQNTGATVPVRGTVRSALTDSPLPRVLVSIQGDITTGALTDGEGRFELPAVPVGPIPFSVRKPGYSTLSAQQDEEIATQNVVVAANMPEIVLRLTPTAAIQGRITLSTGDPAAGVSVHLQRRLILNGRAQWQPPLIQKTDGAGHYRFSNLSEGRYILFTEAFPEDPVGTSAQLKQASRSQEIQGFPGLYYPEAYTAAAAEKIELQPGNLKTADFDLPLLTFHTVQVRLTLPEEVSKDRVQMNLSASVRDHSGNALPFQATLEADNKIVQALLPDGSYTLQISAQPQRFMGTQNEQAAAKSWIGTVEAAVSGHDLTDLHLSLHPMPTGSVQLFKETPSVNNPQAGPFPLIDMNHDSLLASASDEQQNSEFIFPFADTLKNGLNATLPLPPGSYWLAAEAGSGFCEQSLTANGASLVQTPLQIDADQSLPPVTLTLRNDCAALTLSLPSRNAALLPGVEPVYTAWLVPQFDLSSAPGPVTLRPSSGAQATLRDLTPGRYRVYTFADPKPLEFRNPEVVKSLTQSGQDVFLEPGGAMTLTVEVPEP